MQTDQHSNALALDAEENVRTITEREFCKRVGISVGTACALRRAGKLAHCRVGRRVLYIYPRHIEEFLANTERPKAA